MRSHSKLVTIFLIGMLGGGCGDVTCVWCSWLSKMQVAKKVLVDDAGKHPTLDALANAFIYLQVSLPLVSRSTRTPGWALLATASVSQAPALQSVGYGNSKHTIL